MGVDCRYLSIGKTLILFRVDIKYVSLHPQWRIQDFPLGGGADPFGGVTNLRHVHFSAKTYVKMKEMDPVGGGGGGERTGSAPLDPPMIPYQIL